MLSAKKPEKRSSKSLETAGSPAQTEGSECNAELDGAQVSIHVFIDFQGDFSALAPRMRQFLKLGAADFYDCEF